MVSKSRLVLIAVISVFSGGDGTPIDNGIIAEPLVECGADTITVHIQTRNQFHGHVFAKGFYDNPNCRADYSPVGDNKIWIRIPIGECGVRRLRSANPPGLYESVTVVITFHPLFVTKVDRAFNLNCFYMETQKFVTNTLDVSMLSTEVREIVAAMPPCRYEVLNYESVNPDASYLTPVRYARVGQPVLHKWQCNTDGIGLFCMIVHSCTVDDGLGRTVRILDENGCALDKYVLGNLHYDGDTSAQRESHVFKYADKAQVYFQCQIALSVKTGPEQQCPRPVCPEPTRGKRAINETDHVPTETVATADVSNAFTVLDLDENADPKLIWKLNEPIFRRGSSQVCLNAAALGLIVTLVGILTTAMVISSLIRGNKKKRHWIQNPETELISDHEKMPRRGK